MLTEQEIDKKLKGIAISQNDTMEILGITKPTLYKMRKNGELDSVKIDGKVLILTQKMRVLRNNIKKYKKHYYTPEEAAAEIGCTVWFIYKLVRDGKLLYIKDGSRTYISKKSLQNLIRKRLKENGTK